jgi:uncharacterized repeat protein (TIGR04138 family)
MQPIDFEGELSKILEKDSRYHREAYVFLRHGLDFCHKTILKGGAKRGGGAQLMGPEIFRKEAQGIVSENHVSVAQLLDGLRLYALQEYGPMAMTVLESWGVTKCEDFGDLVFNMVEFRLLSITENDTREDFRKGYDFHEAFRAPFKPGKGISKKQAEEPSAK